MVWYDKGEPIVFKAVTIVCALTSLFVVIAELLVLFDF